MSYPPTPDTPFYIHTPDAGQRAFDPYDPAPIRYDASERAPWIHVWPYRYARPSGGFTPGFSSETDGIQCTSSYPHLNICELDI
jgi:hypothetical protein